MANFGQAIKWMEEGKKVIRKSWSKDDKKSSLFLANEGVDKPQIEREGYSFSCKFDSEDVLAKDWILK